MSAADEIRQYAERIVRLETERRDLASDIKDVKAEAKNAGLNVKLIATCVRLMLLEQDKQNAAIREHSELDLYLNAVGLLDGVEAEDATPAVIRPVAQDEGQPVKVGTASDEAPVRGAGSVVTSGQSEEFVTAVETGEAGHTAVDPVSAPDDQVSRESASDLGGDGRVQTPANVVGHPSPGTGQESPGTLSNADPHRPAPHTNTRAVA